MKKTLRVRYWYYLPQVFFIVVLILWLLAAMRQRNLLMRVPLGLFLVGIVVWGITDFITRLRLKIAIDRQRVVVPVNWEFVFMPVNLDGVQVEMPGFEEHCHPPDPLEDDGDSQICFPFYDGKDTLIVPFENITGIWFDKDMQAREFLAIGTDFYDLKFLVRPFGKRRMERFLTENMPTQYPKPNARYQSVLYQVHKENLKQLLAEKSEETTYAYSNLTWLILVAVLLTFGMYTYNNFTLANSVDFGVVWLFLIWISRISFFHTFGDRKFTVSDREITYTVQKKVFRLGWQDVRYLNILFGEIVMWGEGGRLIFPSKLVRRNRVFLSVMTDRLYDGKLEPKMDVFQRVLWNKTARR